MVPKLGFMNTGMQTQPLQGVDTQKAKGFQLTAKEAIEKYGINPKDFEKYDSDKSGFITFNEAISAHDNRVTYAFKQAAPIDPNKTNGANGVTKPGQAGKPEQNKLAFAGKPQSLQQGAKTNSLGFNTVNQVGGYSPNYPNNFVADKEAFNIDFLA